MYGVKPVIIVIILQALWRSGRSAVKGTTTIPAGLLALGLSYFNITPLLILFISGFLGALIENLPNLKPSPTLFTLLTLGNYGIPALFAAPLSPWTLLLTFLKIGAVLYGTGYVLIVFLHTDFVTCMGWITEQQLIDAIAIGQVTPGSLFTTATFIGYLLKGVPAAILSTLGIILPSFILVALSNPLIPCLRQSPWLGAFLDGVNIAALGLMITVTWQIGHVTFPLMDVPAGCSNKHLVDWLQSERHLVDFGWSLRWFGFPRVRLIGAKNS